MKWRDDNCFWSPSDERQLTVFDPPFKNVPPDLYHSHTGPVWLLCNGNSIKAHDLSLIPDDRIVTMNRSWDLRWPTVHVVADSAIHMGRHPDIYKRLDSEDRLFKLGKGGDDFQELGYAMHSFPYPKSKDRGFSRDILEGAILSFGRQGSVGYVALQLAVWLGFNPIYFLGLDLGGPHYYGTPSSPNILEMNSLYMASKPHLAEMGVSAYTVGSPQSACTAYPHISYEESLRGWR